MKNFIVFSVVPNVYVWASEKVIDNQDINILD
jgi:hypothetical protein